MTVPAPSPIPTTSGWQLADWLDAFYTGVADDTGVALITLPQLPDYQRWQLTHMVAGCTSTNATQMRLYLDQVANPSLRDGTASGNFDVADWPAGLMVPNGRQLLARWTGCNPGDPVTLTVQANIWQKPTS